MKKKYIISALIGIVLLAVGYVGHGIWREMVATPVATEPIQLSGKTETALFANGCFWCVEHDIEAVPGVIGAVSGYAGGTTQNPTYENYAASGHREVVEVTYDPTVVTYENLVEHIIKHGDPTDAEGSFYDRGVSYSPAIYYKDDEQKNKAMSVITAIEALRVYKKPLTIAVEPLATFWPAEEYHQDYSKKNELKYSYYRNASGRTKFFETVWGKDAYTFTVTEAPQKSVSIHTPTPPFNQNSWATYTKPSQAVLKETLSPLVYKVTQEEGTERPGSSALDKNYEPGIYVDVISGEPLFSSRDKYDSGTGWPSFVKTLSAEVVTLTEDNTLFTKRTEVRSRYADSHIGHVFPDGPAERGGMRYCMNGAALRFIPKDDMVREGYEYLLLEI